MSDAPQTARVRIRVAGRVQGVGFRAFTAGTARALGVAGWVRNTADGDVEAVAEGPPRAVDALLRALRAGPTAAEVVGLDAREEDPEGLVGFEVRG